MAHSPSWDSKFYCFTIEMTFNRRPNHRRHIHGVLLLDKPPGKTSNEALQSVKRLFRASKAGHTGSLDPLASGLLPICLGEATKLSGFLLDADKRYWVRCQLGEKTTTGDAEGEVILKRPVGALPTAHLMEILKRFTGDIEQTPPMYSAIKHHGERLYKLARQGIEVERTPRKISVYSMALLRHENDTLDLEIHCSKGTYIRSLAEDIGETLGCGGHVAALRRLGVGPYQNADQMVSLEKLHTLAEQGEEALDNILLPLESALNHWPQITLNEDSTYYLCKGQPVLVPKAPTTGWVRLHNSTGDFLGVGKILADGRVAPQRLMNIRVPEHKS